MTTKDLVESEDREKVDIVVNEQLRHELLQVTLELPAGVYHDSLKDREQFLSACQKIRDVVRGTPLGQALEELKAGKRTVLSIKGLPVDPSLPAAPIDGGSPRDKRTFVSEGSAAGLASAVGFPSIIIGEKKNALVHQITPVPGREKTLSNEGLVSLGFHQDMAPNAEIPDLPYHEFMPDWLILTGVQKGTGATPTLLASVDEALTHVSPQAYDVLHQKRFKTDPPESFLKESGQAAADIQVPLHPILSKRNGYTESAFDSTSNVRPADPADTEALRALREFESALGKVSQEVLIEPGTSVIFNNRRVAHGRGPVKQESDEAGRRWLQRIYIFDLPRVSDRTNELELGLRVGSGVLQVTSSIF